MNATFQKTLVIAIGVFVVLFLLLDGGAMTEATLSGGMAANDTSLSHGWVWIIPTLLIFGLGFLLAWFVLGEDDMPPSESHTDRTLEMSGHGNLRPHGKD